MALEYLNDRAIKYDFEKKIFVFCFLLFKLDSFGQNFKLESSCWQFLSESVVVSVVGGSLGILLGWIITASLSAVTGWATSVSLDSVLLSFFFSALIGIVFGVYPARKAARLNPIDALRSE